MLDGNSKQQSKPKLKEPFMNTFKITLELKTYSADPEDWIVDGITQQLEQDEALVSCNVERVTLPTPVKS